MTTRRRGEATVHNIGPGVAVNVFVVVPVSPTEPHARLIGSLGAGQDFTPSIGVFGNGHSMTISHLVVAEGVHSRTAQWTVSLNAALEGGLFHRMADYHISDHRLSLQEFLQLHWSSLFKQLQDYEKEAKELALAGPVVER